jgi:hypothetical protein
MRKQRFGRLFSLALLTLLIPLLLGVILLSTQQNVPDLRSLFAVTNRSAVFQNASPLTETLKSQEALTSSVSSLRVVSQERLDTLTFADGATVDIHNPKFSPFSDRYLFSTLVNGAPTGLWLASITNGPIKVFFKEGAYFYQWGPDDEHILYSPMPKYDQPAAQPVYLRNLATDAVRELGQTTLGWDIDSTAAGDIAFLNEDTLVIINTNKDVKKQIDSVFTIGHPPTPTPVPIPSTEPEKIPDFLLTPEPTDPADSQRPTGEQILSFQAMYPYLQVRFDLSPDGAKVVLHQIAYDSGSLVLVDLTTQQSTLLTTEAGNTWYPFGWSSDSKTLAYSTFSKETSLPELWLLSLNGNNPPQQLNKEQSRGKYEFVTWLTNRPEIVYVFTPSGPEASQRSQYRLVDPSPGNAYLLFEGGTTIQLADHGNYLYFYKESHSEGMFEIEDWIMRLGN